MRRNAPSARSRPAMRRSQALAGSMLATALLSAASAARAQIVTDQDSTVPSVPGPTDTVLPRTGIDPGVSDLREHLLRAYGDTPAPTAATGPNLQITGQLGVSEEFTNNVGAIAGGGGGRGGGGSDAITEVQPGITIVDTTERLLVNLNYQPTAQIYARHFDFSQFEQQFDGSIVATALPGWLYVDLRGSVSQQAVYGGLGPASTVTLSPGNRQTVSSVSLSPYLSRSLGPNGTVQAGASYAYSATDSPDTAGPVDPLLQGLGNYGNSYLATKRAFANYTTGETLGRLRNKVGIDASFYDGAGALAGGRRILLTDDISYALTRLVTLLGEVGYEDLAYPRSDFFYSGPIGSGGVQLTPTRGSSLTVEYRYVDGFGSAFVQGSVQVSPRIRVFGGYSAGISTFEQDVQNTLLDSADDTTGTAASALQAAPLLAADNAFGANQNLNRTHRLDASATYLGTNDTVTLSVQRETTTPVGRQVGQFPPVSTSGVYGNITVTHELTPALTLTGFAQYGSNQTGLAQGAFGRGNGAGQTVSVSVGLNRVFTDTLTGYVRFGGTYLVGGSAFAAAGYQGLGGSDTTFVVGALKRF